MAITIPDGVVGTQLLTIEGPGGTSVELPIEVAAAPEPVDTSLRATVNRLLVFGNQTVTYRVTATAADGSEPVGTVTVYDGSRVLTTIELEAGDGGQATVTLPSLSRGIHLLTGRFTGEGFEPSIAFPSVVIVLR